MSLYVRQGGTYKLVDFDDLYRRNAGVYSKMNELYVRHAGVYKLAWRADGPPPAPTSLAATAVNGGIINTSWAWPINAENDYNRVEVQQPGDIARIGTNYAGTTQQRTGYGHGVGVSLQARTVDNGGQTSAWVSFPGVTTLNAAPGAAAATVFGWNGSTITATWNEPGNPYGDMGTTYVYYRTAAEGGWTLGWSGAYTGGAGRTVGLPQRGYDTFHYMFVRTSNNAGVTDSNVLGAWTPPAPGTVKDLVPHEGNSYAFAAAAWRNDDTVRQGMFSPTPMGLHFGCYFYGDQLWNAGHGHTPVSGEIFMYRFGTQGFTGPVFFTGHPFGWRPAGQPTGSGVGWTSVSEFAGADASAWEPLPSAALASIAANTTKGIGIFTFSDAQSNYKVFTGPGMNGYAGIVRLRW